MNTQVTCRQNKLGSSVNWLVGYNRHYCLDEHLKLCKAKIN